MTEKEQEIFESLKSNIPDEYEKETPGFWTYDFLAASAVEQAKLYEAVQIVANKLNVANLVGEELTRECLYRRGIKRKEAKPADVVLKITGVGTIKIGDLFSTENKIEFKAIETKSINGIDTITAQCTQAGLVGMVGANSITQMPITITGITAVTNEQASFEGYEEETDKSLLERYLDDVQKPATSNNVYQFEKWAREVAGVGKAKVFPTWNGNNSVKVVIINDDMQPASEQLVSDTQTYIDPIDPNKCGRGYGQSALGSYCTVASGIAKECNVFATIQKSNNYTIEEIRESIQNSIVDYLKEIAFDENINYVSYAKIAAIIVNTEGVLDLGIFTLNEVNSNVMIEDEEIGILGTFEVEVT